ncbi:Uncharacterised protein [Citrobacter freundii]|nr:Uncharacterised protein [Citrobacter freundii]SUX73532.1 Uncharacterised protein [Citrobacter freundii]
MNHPPVKSSHIFRDFLSVVSKGRFYDDVIKGTFPEIKIK